MAEKRYLDLTGLKNYDAKVKAHIKQADDEVLANAKQYADELADNYDAAGTAASKVQELANGAVKSNTEAIAKLNGDETTEGSVKKAVADAKSELSTAIGVTDGKADKNAGDISALGTRMTAVEKKATDNATNHDALKKRVDTAETDIDAIEEDIGNVDVLDTTSKTIVGAINEAMSAIGSGGTAAIVTLTSKGATAEYANVYELAQGGSSIGTINIPKDMVVESGSVVDLGANDVEGLAAGKYIKLILQNVKKPLYIAVNSLVDIYVAKQEAAQVQIEINSSTREISAYVVAGSITSVELGANAVVTEKIADGNVTKVKLSTEVQGSLEKADVAETNAKAYADNLDSAMDTRMKAVEKALAGTGEGSVEDKIDAAKQEVLEAAKADATTKANAAETNAKAYADNLNTAMDTRVTALEDDTHTHANKAELDKIKSGDVAKWNAAQTNAEGTAAAALAAAKAELESKISAGDEANKALIDGHETRITSLEAKVGDGFKEITTEEINALFTA